MSTLRVTFPVPLNAIEFRKVANASAGRAHLAAPTRLTRPAGNPTPYGGNAYGRRRADVLDHAGPALAHLLLALRVRRRRTRVVARAAFVEVRHGTRAIGGAQLLLALGVGDRRPEGAGLTDLARIGHGVADAALTDLLLARVGGWARVVARATLVEVRHGTRAIGGAQLLLALGVGDRRPEGAGLTDLGRVGLDHAGAGATHLPLTGVRRARRPRARVAFVGRREHSARAGALIARHGVALFVRAGRAEIDRTRLGSGRLERSRCVVTRSIGLRLVEPRGLGDRSLGGGGEAGDLHIELELTEGDGRGPGVGGDVERGARRQDDLVRRGAVGRVGGGPPRGAVGRDRGVAGIRDDRAEVGAVELPGRAVRTVEIEPHPVHGHLGAAGDRAREH